MPAGSGSREQQKARSRQRLLVAASRRLRLGGPESVGIQAVSADAGLTHGAFYAHFRDKEELTNAAFAYAIEQGQQRWFEDAARAGTFSGRLARLARAYLSPEHRDDPGGGCALAALASALETAPASLRANYARAVEKTVQKIAEDDPDRLDAAVDFLATLIGALTLARNTADPELSARILRAAAARFTIAA